MLNDEMKGVARFLYALGFPLGLLAIVGAFSVGLAVWYGEISLSSKRLLLGIFLVSVSGFFWYLQRIYRTVAFIDEKKVKAFSFGALIGSFITAIAMYASWVLLWPLLSN